MDGSGSGSGKMIIACPNAFKGSLGAPEAAAAIARGVRAALPGGELRELPLADGGDGTTECIVRATGGRLFHQTVTGPLGDPVEGFWGLTGDGGTAVVEIAAASGLARLSRERRANPEAAAISTTAVPPSPVSPQKPSTGSPRGPVTVW